MLTNFSILLQNITLLYYSVGEWKCMRWCVYGCYILRLVGGFLLYLGQNRGSVSNHAVNSGDKRLFLLLYLFLMSHIRFWVTVL